MQETLQKLLVFKFLTCLVKNVYVLMHFRTSVAAILDFSILRPYWTYLSWAYSRFGFTTLQ